MIAEKDFVQSYNNILTKACSIANERFPDIPTDEWSISVLCHTEGTPQVTLFHTPDIEITTPIDNNKIMIVNDGVMELI